MVEEKLFIDSHVHITATGYFVRQNGSKKHASIETLFKDMNFNRIYKSVLLPIGTMPNFIKLIKIYLNTKEIEFCLFKNITGLIGG